MAVLTLAEHVARWNWTDDGGAAGSATVARHPHPLLSGSGTVLKSVHSQELEIKDKQLESINFNGGKKPAHSYIKLSNFI